MVKALLNIYAKHSQSHPLRTNIFVGCGVWFFGDLFAQKLLEKREQINLTRLTVSSSWSGISSPFFFFWFRILDHKFPGTSHRQVLKKVLINLIVVPPVNATFLMYSTIIEGLLRDVNDIMSSYTEGKRRVIEDTAKLCISSTLFWFPVNYLNFAFVSPRFRVLPSIFVGVCWGAFLSLIGHRKL